MDHTIPFDLPFNIDSIRTAHDLSQIIILRDGDLLPDGAIPVDTLSKVFPYLLRRCYEITSPLTPQAIDRIVSRAVDYTTVISEQLQLLANPNVPQIITFSAQQIVWRSITLLHHFCTMLLTPPPGSSPTATPHDANIAGALRAVVGLADAGRHLATVRASLTVRGEVDAAVLSCGGAIFLLLGRVLDAAHIDDSALESMRVEGTRDGLIPRWEAVRRFMLQYIDLSTAIVRRSSGQHLPVMRKLSSRETDNFNKLAFEAFQYMSEPAKRPEVLRSLDERLQHDFLEPHRSPSVILDIHASIVAACPSVVLTWGTLKHFQSPNSAEYFCNKLLMTVFSPFDEHVAADPAHQPPAPPARPSYPCVLATLMPSREAAPELVRVAAVLCTVALRMLNTMYLQLVVHEFSAHSLSALVSMVSTCAHHYVGVAALTDLDVEAADESIRARTAPLWHNVYSHQKVSYGILSPELMEISGVPSLRLDFMLGCIKHMVAMIVAGMQQNNPQNVLRSVLTRALYTDFNNFGVFDQPPFAASIVQGLPAALATRVLAEMKVHIGRISEIVDLSLTTSATPEPPDDTPEVQRSVNAYFDRSGADPGRVAEQPAPATATTVNRIITGSRFANPGPVPLARLGELEYYAYMLSDAPTAIQFAVSKVLPHLVQTVQAAAAVASPGVLSVDRMRVMAQQTVQKSPPPPVTMRIEACAHVAQFIRALCAIHDKFYAPAVHEDIIAGYFPAMGESPANTNTNNSPEESPSSSSQGHGMDETGGSGPVPHGGLNMNPMNRHNDATNIDNILDIIEGTHTPTTARSACTPRWSRPGAPANLNEVARRLDTMLRADTQVLTTEQAAMHPTYVSKEQRNDSYRVITRLVMFAFRSLVLEVDTEIFGAVIEELMHCIRLPDGSTLKGSDAEIYAGQPVAASLSPGYWATRLAPRPGSEAFEAANTLPLALFVRYIDIVFNANYITTELEDQMRIELLGSFANTPARLIGELQLATHILPYPRWASLASPVALFDYSLATLAATEPTALPNLLSRLVINTSTMPLPSVLQVILGREVPTSASISFIESSARLLNSMWRHLPSVIIRDLSCIRISRSLDIIDDAGDRLTRLISLLHLVTVMTDCRVSDIRNRAGGNESNFINVLEARMVMSRLPSELSQTVMYILLTEGTTTMHSISNDPLLAHQPIMIDFGIAMLAFIMSVMRAHPEAAAPENWLKIQLDTINSYGDLLFEPTGSSIARIIASGCAVPFLRTLIEVVFAKNFSRADEIVQIAYMQRVLQVRATISACNASSEHIPMLKQLSNVCMEFDNVGRMLMPEYYQFYDPNITQTDTQASHTHLIALAAEAGQHAKQLNSGDTTVPFAQILRELIGRVVSCISRSQVRPLDRLPVCPSATVTRLRDSVAAWHNLEFLRSDKITQTTNDAWMTAIGANSYIIFRDLPSPPISDVMEDALSTEALMALDACANTLLTESLLRDGRFSTCTDLFTLAVHSAVVAVAFSGANSFIRTGSWVPRALETLMKASKKSTDVRRALLTVVCDLLITDWVGVEFVQSLLVHVLLIVTSYDGTSTDCSWAVEYMCSHVNDPNQLPLVINVIIMICELAPNALSDEDSASCIRHLSPYISFSAAGFDRNVALFRHLLSVLPSGDFTLSVIENLPPSSELNYAVISHYCDFARRGLHIMPHQQVYSRVISTLKTQVAQFLQRPKPVRDVFSTAFSDEQRLILVLRSILFHLDAAINLAQNPIEACRDIVLAIGGQEQVLAFIQHLMTLGFASSTFSLLFTPATADHNDNEHVLTDNNNVMMRLSHSHAFIMFHIVLRLIVAAVAVTPNFEAFKTAINVVLAREDFSFNKLTYTTALLSQAVVQRMGGPWQWQCSHLERPFGWMHSMFVPSPGSLGISAISITCQLIVQLRSSSHVAQAAGQLLSEIYTVIETSLNKQQPDRGTILCYPVMDCRGPFMKWTESITALEGRLRTIRENNEFNNSRERWVPLVHELVRLQSNFVICTRSFVRVRPSDPNYAAVVQMIAQNLFVRANHLNEIYTRCIYDLTQYAGHDHRVGQSLCHDLAASVACYPDLAVDVISELFRMFSNPQATTYEFIAAAILTLLDFAAVRQRLADLHFTLPCADAGVEQLTVMATMSRFLPDLRTTLLENGMLYQTLGQRLNIMAMSPEVDSYACQKFSLIKISNSTSLSLVDYAMSLPAYRDSMNTLHWLTRIARPYYLMPAQLLPAVAATGESWPSCFVRYGPSSVAEFISKFSLQDRKITLSSLIDYARQMQVMNCSDVSVCVGSILATTVSMDDVELASLFSNLAFLPTRPHWVSLIQACNLIDAQKQFRFTVGCGREQQFIVSTRFAYFEAATAVPPEQLLNVICQQLALHTYGTHDFESNFATITSIISMVVGERPLHRPLSQLRLHILYKCYAAMCELAKTCINRYRESVGSISEIQLLIINEITNQRHLSQNANLPANHIQGVLYAMNNTMGTHIRLSERNSNLRNCTRMVKDCLDVIQQLHQINAGLPAEPEEKEFTPSTDPKRALNKLIPDFTGVLHPLIQNDKGRATPAPGTLAHAINESPTLRECCTTLMLLLARTGMLSSVVSKVIGSSCNYINNFLMHLGMKAATIHSQVDRVMFMNFLQWMNSINEAYNSNKDIMQRYVSFSLDTLKMLRDSGVRLPIDKDGATSVLNELIFTIPRAQRQPDPTTDQRIPLCLHTLPRDFNITNLQSVDPRTLCELNADIIHRGYVTHVHLFVALVDALSPAANPASNMLPYMSQHLMKIMFNVDKVAAAGILADYLSVLPLSSIVGNPTHPGRLLLQMGIASLWENHNAAPAALIESTRFFTRFVSESATPTLPPAGGNSNQINLRESMNAVRPHEQLQALWIREVTSRGAHIVNNNQWVNQPHHNIAVKRWVGELRELTRHINVLAQLDSCGAVAIVDFMIPIVITSLFNVMISEIDLRRSFSDMEQHLAVVFIQNLGYKFTETDDVATALRSENAFARLAAVFATTAAHGHEFSRKQAFAAAEQFLRRAVCGDIETPDNPVFWLLISDEIYAEALLHIGGMLSRLTQPVQALLHQVSDVMAKDFQSTKIDEVLFRARNVLNYIVGETNSVPARDASITRSPETSRILDTTFSVISGLDQHSDDPNRMAGLTSAPTILPPLFGVAAAGDLTTGFADRRNSLREMLMLLSTAMACAKHTTSTFDRFIKRSDVVSSAANQVLTGPAFASAAYLLDARVSGLSQLHLTTATEEGIAPTAPMADNDTNPLILVNNVTQPAFVAQQLYDNTATQFPFMRTMLRPIVTHLARTGATTTFSLVGASVLTSTILKARARDRTPLRLLCTAPHALAAIGTLALPEMQGEKGASMRFIAGIVLSDTLGLNVRNFTAAAYGVSEAAIEAVLNHLVFTGTAGKTSTHTPAIANLLTSEMQAPYGVCPPAVSTLTSTLVAQTARNVLVETFRNAVIGTSHAAELWLTLIAQSTAADSQTRDTIVDAVTCFPLLANALTAGLKLSGATNRLTPEQLSLLQTAAVGQGALNANQQTVSRSYESVVLDAVLDVHVPSQAYIGVTPEKIQTELVVPGVHDFVNNTSTAWTMFCQLIHPDLRPAVLWGINADLKDYLKENDQIQLQMPAMTTHAVNLCAGSRHILPLVLVVSPGVALEALMARPSALYAAQHQCPADMQHLAMTALSEMTCSSDYSVISIMGAITVDLMRVARGVASINERLNAFAQRIRGSMATNTAAVGEEVRTFMRETMGVIAAIAASRTRALAVLDHIRPQITMDDRITLRVFVYSVSNLAHLLLSYTRLSGFVTLWQLSIHETPEYRRQFLDNLIKDVRTPVDSFLRYIDDTIRDKMFSEPAFEAVYMTAQPPATIAHYTQMLPALRILAPVGDATAVRYAAAGFWVIVQAWADAIRPTAGNALSAITEIHDTARAMSLASVVAAQTRSVIHRTTDPVPMIKNVEIATENFTELSQLQTRLPESTYKLLSIRLDSARVVQAGYCEGNNDAADGWAAHALTQLDRLRLVPTAEDAAFLPPLSGGIGIRPHYLPTSVIGECVTIAAHVALFSKDIETVEAILSMPELLPTVIIETVLPPSGPRVTPIVPLPEIYTSMPILRSQIGYSIAIARQPPALSDFSTLLTRIPPYLVTRTPFGRTLALAVLSQHASVSDGLSATNDGDFADVTRRMAPLLASLTATAPPRIVAGVISSLSACVSGTILSVALRQIDAGMTEEVRGLLSEHISSALVSAKIRSRGSTLTTTLAEQQAFISFWAEAPLWAVAAASAGASVEQLRALCKFSDNVDVLLGVHSSVCKACETAMLAALDLTTADDERVQGLKLAVEAFVNSVHLRSDIISPLRTLLWGSVQYTTYPAEVMYQPSPFHTTFSFTDLGIPALVVAWCGKQFVILTEPPSSIKPMLSLRQTTATSRRDAIATYAAAAVLGVPAVSRFGIPVAYGNLLLFISDGARHAHLALCASHHDTPYLAPLASAAQLDLGLTMPAGGASSATMHTGSAVVRSMAGALELSAATRFSPSFSNVPAGLLRATGFTCSRALGVGTGLRLGGQIEPPAVLKAYARAELHNPCVYYRSVMYGTPGTRPIDTVMQLLPASVQQVIALFSDIFSNY